MGDPTVVGNAASAGRAVTTTPGPSDASGRNTVVLVVITAITNLADGVTKIAFPLMATTLTKSPIQISAISLTLTLPWLLAALHVGVLVDRVDRRKLLWLANIARVIVVLGVLAANAAGVVTLPLLYIGGLTLGVAEVIALTAATAVVPDAVAPPGRQRINTWMAGAETVCNEFAGPLLGGLLVVVGASFALGGTAVGYVVGMVALLFLVGKFRPARPEGKPESLNSQIRDGLSFLWRQPVLRLMALVLTILCACWGVWLGLMPLVATQQMGLDASGYGILLSALGVGGLFGALVVSTVNRWLGRQFVMFANIFLTLALVLMPAVTTNLVAVAAGAFLGGMGGTLWSINARTIAQQLVSSEMMGRYSAAAKMFSWGSFPVGAGLAGVLAEWFGTQVAFAIFSVATLTLIVPFLRIFTAEALAKIDAGDVAVRGTETAPEPEK